MFLFGTMAFEEAISFLVTKNFKNLLKTATKNLISSISTGFFATSILQSSAVVSLIAVSFVGAGII
jgi:phosphate:Na+ symporter